MVPGPFTLALGAVGLAVLAYGARRLRPVVHVLRNDPIDVYRLPNHPGPVEVEGEARVDRATGEAPFSGRECLAYEYEAQELRSSGKHSHWETLDEGGAAADFLVDDGTGTVRVEPQRASLHLESHTITVQPGDEPPGRIAEFLAESEEIDPQDRTLDLRLVELNLGNEQRFIERRLDVDETVYVYGEAFAEQSGGWGSGVVNAVIREGERAPAFVVSDAPERATAWRMAKGPLLWTGVGFVALLFAFFTAV
ncbi:E3 ubiquitin ligase family protein [Halomicrobium salinisoli]|uniref:E3 ubiquitin ligase family protein n=1 Tax=Halomicrobium salinisoli TaxID=2878391 RepID=UPI001CF09706|nr:E3 ubiquitin ligase family protein [Halomicrobium salinisoli]